MRKILTRILPYFIFTPVSSFTQFHVITNAKFKLYLIKLKEDRSFVSVRVRVWTDRCTIFLDKRIKSLTKSKSIQRVYIPLL